MAAEERLSADKTEARSKSPDGVGPKGVLGAGSVNVNVWIVEAG